MSSGGRRASLVQSLEGDSGGGITLHMAERQRKGVDGRRIDCTIAGYCQTRIFDFPGVMLTEESEVGPHVIAEASGFRATIASDLDCYFNSVSASRHYSIDRSLRISVENLARRRKETKPSGELSVFVVTEEDQYLPETRMNRGECYAVDEAEFLHGGRPGHDAIQACKTLDGSWPGSPSDTRTVNAVLAAVRVEQNATDHIVERLDCFCFVSDAGEAVYPSITSVSAAVTKVSPVDREAMAAKAARIGTLFRGLDRDRGILEVAELIDAVHLGKSQHDEYLRLWYLRLWQAARDAGRHLGFRQFENTPRLLEGVSTPKEQTSHRNAIAHWCTGKADAKFRSDLQRNVFEMLRRKYCPKLGRQK